MELEVKKAKANGAVSKSAPYQKPCEKMTEAVVMDGGRRGELVADRSGFAVGVVGGSADDPMIRVMLPTHLQVLAQAPREVKLEVNAPVIDYPGSSKALIDRAVVLEPMRRWRERLCAMSDLIVTPNRAIR